MFNNRDDHAKNSSFRMDATFAWKLAPCYDLSYGEGPSGEHQMDIEGEARTPGKADLLMLATANDLKATWTVGVMDRISSVAGNFGALAAGYPIRAATRGRARKAIERNRLRMA